MGLYGCHLPADLEPVDGGARRSRYRADVRPARLPRAFFIGIQLGMTDKELAIKVLSLLRQLHTGGADAALAEPGTLTNALGNTHPSEILRADAWLAVCTVCEAGRPDSETPKTPGQIPDAIAKMEVWQQSLG